MRLAWASSTLLRVPVALGLLGAFLTSPNILKRNFARCAAEPRGATTAAKGAARVLPRLTREEESEGVRAARTVRGTSARVAAAPRSRPSPAPSPASARRHFRC